MISPHEIEFKAREFDIHTSNVQRDYVFGWLLFGIFTISNLKESILIKGGNALRKGYFSETRYSRDLDFGIPGDIGQEELLAQINHVCDAIQERAGIAFVKDSNKVQEKFTATDVPLPDLKVYEARVYFKDFLGGSDHITLRVSMDVTRFDRVILPLQERKLIHPYSDGDALICDIRCMKLEEIIGGTPCTVYLQSLNATTPCGQFQSIATLQHTEANNISQSIWLVPKAEICKHPGNFTGVVLDVIDSRPPGNRLFIPGPAFSQLFQLVWK